MILHPEVHHKGILVILSSPSGAGKTTLCKRLLQNHPSFSLSISVTTRQPRSGEQDGKDYHFRSKEEFDALVKAEAFLEYATVFGHHYGTLRRPIEDSLSAGNDVFFDIDWQGTQQLQQSIPDDIVSIFILPPSLQELHKRLRLRNQDPAAIIEKRMREAVSEISHWPEYNYVLINEDLEKTVTQLAAIIHGEKLKRRRQFGLEKFIKNLVNPPEGLGL